MAELIVGGEVVAQLMRRRIDAHAQTDRQTNTRPPPNHPPTHAYVCAARATMLHCLPLGLDELRNQVSRLKVSGGFPNARAHTPGHRHVHSHAQPHKR